MNISDVKATATPRLDLLKNNSVETSGSTEPPVREAVSRERADRSEDRVEISDEARASLSDARASDELSFARSALENLPPLTEDRITELTDRIKSRYYRQADVQGSISEMVGNELRKDI